MPSVVEPDSSEDGEPIQAEAFGSTSANALCDTSFEMAKVIHRLERSSNATPEGANQLRALNIQLLEQFYFDREVELSAISSFFG